MIAAESKTKASLFWIVTPEWQGQPCYIIGGGASLAGFDFNLLKGRRVLGCNDAFRLGPEIVSYGVFADSAFYCRHTNALINSGVPLVTCSPTLVNMKTPPHVFKLRREMHGLHNHDTVGFNYSTGAMCVNLAVNLGATSIYLLGFDMTNVSGKSHWHTHNPKTTRDFSFKRFQQGFAKVKASLPEDIHVINVTDGSSRLEPFPRITFPQFYQHLQETTI